MQKMREESKTRTAPFGLGGCIGPTPGGRGQKIGSVTDVTYPMTQRAWCVVEHVAMRLAMPCGPVLRGRSAPNNAMHRGARLTNATAILRACARAPVERRFADLLRFTSSAVIACLVPTQSVINEHRPLLSRKKCAIAE